MGDKWVTSARKPTPFYLEDNNGRILVNPGTKKGRFMSLSEMAHLSIQSNNLRGSLNEGDPVYVVGTAEPNVSAPPTAVESEAIVVQRRTPTVGIRWLREAIDLMLIPLLGNKEKSGSYVDVFFVSRSREDGVLEQIRRMRKRLVVVASLAVLLCVWIGVSRHERLALPVQLAGDPVMTVRMDPLLRSALAYAQHVHPGYREFSKAELGGWGVTKAHSVPLSGEAAMQLLASSVPEVREFAAGRLQEVALGEEQVDYLAVVYDNFRDSGPRARMTTIYCGRLP